MDLEKPGNKVIYQAIELEQLMDTKGTIFNIQHFCIHDGPGIRSTVFLKGCQYDCLWCHNPEGIPFERQMSFVSSKCVLCKECAKICPEAHIFNEDPELISPECESAKPETHDPDANKHIIRREILTFKQMEKSASVCITKALTVVGNEVTAGEVLTQVLRDRSYYDESGGGVTFSGGEPTLQKSFLTALLKLVSNEGIHTALETNGHCDYVYYESIIPYVSLFLMDYKETDPVKHREHTKAGNDLVKENIKKLHDAGAAVLLRCPVIPDLNDTEVHFKGIAEMTIKFPNLLGAEILPYHKLASAKTSHLGITGYEEYVQPNASTAEMWREKVRSYGGRIVEN